MKTENGKERGRAAGAAWRAIRNLFEPTTNFKKEWRRKRENFWKLYDREMILAAGGAR